jgi:hypothetical protein
MRRGVWAAHGGHTYEDEREDLDPAAHGPLAPDDVAELADRERLRNRVRTREGGGEAVEAVRDRRVLHDVALVQDVRPRGRHRDRERVAVRARGGRQRHAREQRGVLGGGEGQACAVVDVRRVRGRVPCRQVRRQLHRPVGVYDPHGLDPGAGVSYTCHYRHNNTDVYGSAQYSENIAEMMFATTCSFVSSVAVMSMNTFVVFSVILLCSELMIGGIDSTRSSAS